MAIDIPEYCRSYVGGRWLDGTTGQRIAVEDPATGEMVSEAALATAVDIDRAVGAARACVKSGALTNPRPCERGRLISRVAGIMRERAEEIGLALCREGGKSISAGRAEAEFGARIFEYYGGMADKIEGRFVPLGADYIDYVVPTPYGISAQVVPWNFPIDIMSRSVAPALAAGNAVVVKTPELSPVACFILAQCCESAGLPPGSVNVLCGYGNEAGAALVAHGDVNQIVFTGSVKTGQSVLAAAAKNIIPCVVELGGKSAGIVYPDADLDLVADSLRWGTFYNAGQICSALSRLLVHSSIYDNVVDRIVSLVNGLTIGPGIDDSDITPVISAVHLDRVEQHALTAVQQGASAMIGGRRLADRPGHFMAPTILVDVAPDARVAQDEVFGPVLSVLRFDSDEEALAIANSTEFGLASGVFTRDLDRAIWTAGQLEAGLVYVNEWYAGGVEAPFGGTKKSGYGRERGQEGLGNYYYSKNIGIRRRAPSA